MTKTEQITQELKKSNLSAECSYGGEFKLSEAIFLMKQSLSLKKH